MSHQIRDVFPGSYWLVRGNVPTGSYLLIGPTGVGKTIFCKQFLYNGLIKDDPAIFLSPSELPDDVSRSMQTFGFDIEPYSKEDLFRIVDCYSWKVGERSTSKYALSSDRNYLLEVQINFDKARQNLQNIRVVYDSLSDMVLLGEPAAMIRCLQYLIARIRASKGYGFFTIAANTHDDKVMNQLRIRFDGIIEMKIDDSGKDLKRLIRIFSLKGAQHRTAWTPFEINNNGILVKRDIDTRCSFCGKLIDVMPIVERIDDQTYWFDNEECVTTYKKFKELQRQNQNLRDHMTDWELILTMVGEKATTDITVSKDSREFPELKHSAKEGGNIAKNTRKEIEQKTGKSLVSKENYLHLEKKKKKEFKK